MNELIASYITYCDQKDANKPNVMTILDRLHNRQGTIEDAFKNKLHSLREYVQLYTLPTELTYLSDTARVLEEVGFSVLKKIGVN